MLVIYDGNCNLCVTLVQFLEMLDRGQQFHYLPMQNQAGLSEFGINLKDCEAGMILLNPDQPAQRWQGSAAAEEIGRILPGGGLFMGAYQALPGLKGLGDRVYEQVRDFRYQWFGQRSHTYESDYPYCAQCHPQQPASEAKSRDAQD
ncbi:MAG: DUF393 domain-containing protein [Oscillatoriales cyanobacterium RM1_1_9]|nr:DUF393 domain-containing protein [Oscillatoriales cyanobacterium SM2_3_0]NJO47456.1 DUF393 domain-containing protein [Oscillatoriales cyanobacterium RM2_1_1]NJO71384.1 DUF393 domain-containing protein [Oscillatoriales cyanobacterium RM1_1_9]